MPSLSTGLRASFLGRVAREYPIAAFVIGAVVWTWGYGSIAIIYFDTPVLIVEIARIPAIWGPLLAAGAVIWLNEGNLSAWLGQVTNWNVSPYWYGVAFGLPIVFTELSSLIALLTGVPIEYGGLQPPWLYIGGFLLIFLTMGALEEFGWRGFAQPIIQERYTAVHASLFIGFVWAVWHYYLFALDMPFYSDVNIVFYTIRATTVSFIYAWVYNGTGGSVLIAMIFHATGNLAALFQPAGDIPGWLDLLGVYPLLIIVQVPIAVGLALVYGPKYLAGSSPNVSPATLLGR